MSSHLCCFIHLTIASLNHRLVKEVQKTSPKPKKDEKDAAAVSKHEQKGKHSEEAARGSKRMLGKKQMQ